MDSGSQKTYMTYRVKESLHIETFGSAEGQDATCEAVDLRLVTKDGEAY